MSQHTPGPWEVIPPRRGLESRAMVGASIGADIYDAPLTTETAANARLIAAAPDLLAALEHLVGWPNCACDKPLGFYLNHAREVIRKARGESPPMDPAMEAWSQCC